MNVDLSQQQIGLNNTASTVQFLLFLSAHKPCRHATYDTVTYRVRFSAMLLSTVLYCTVSVSVAPTFPLSSSWSFLLWMGYFRRPLPFRPYLVPSWHKLMANPGPAPPLNGTLRYCTVGSTSHWRHCSLQLCSSSTRECNNYGRYNNPCLCT